jgi:hypothetical protein
VIVATFGILGLHAQVIKTRRNNRVIRVETKVAHGQDSRVSDALTASEDSTTLNTSFIERLNLTIRQGCAYLGRRSLAHARRPEHLRADLLLLKCHYNFIRGHRGLKFGKALRTPAMQAGLASRKLTFRDVFLSREARVVWLLFLILNARRRTAHRQHWLA